MSADKLYRKIDPSRLNGIEIRRHHPKRRKGLNDRVRRWNVDLAAQTNPAGETDELMEIRRHHPKRCNGLNDHVGRWKADLAAQTNPAGETDELMVKYAPNHQKRMDFLLSLGRNGSRRPRQQLSPLTIVETIPWDAIREKITDPQEATLVHMLNTIVITKNI